MTDTVLPIVDLDIFLSQPLDAPAVQHECKKVCTTIGVHIKMLRNLTCVTQAADALITYGALLLRDSRVSEEDNIEFLDLIEDYFAQPETLLKQDERPELGYQVREHSSPGLYKSEILR